ncbi:MAG TPA: L,D-transpeptidase [Thermopetrobacter sp.]|nr:L,D-transpeptidase [Thermopetrobacter sp.]
MVIVTLLTVLTGRALARVEAHIDLSRQRMTVYVDGRYYDTWRVSTGRPGYYTPRGTYRPYLLKRMHYSTKYDNAPMPYSVFFRGGYAIHGTNIISRLGRPASHGCVRLHPRNAEEFFNLIRRHGMRNTVIRITGVTPRYTPRRRYRRNIRRRRNPRRNFHYNSWRRTARGRVEIIRTGGF